jgi:hypothetical protein
MARRLQCVACVFPRRMVLRNTGLVHSFNPCLATRLSSKGAGQVVCGDGNCRSPEPRVVPAVRIGRTCTSSPCRGWPRESVRAFSGAWPSRRVPVRCRARRLRSVTKGAALLGGWRLLALLGMRAHANVHPKANPFARSVSPSPRMTCNISTCAKRTTWL